MRISEFSGVYHMIDDISPEAYRAQRMAELEQIARYRALRMAQYKAWADETQRTQIQLNLKVEEAKARAEMSGKTVYLPRRLKLDEMVSIVEVAAPRPKRSWWARLFGRK